MMDDFEKKYQLAKSRAERLKKSARVSEELLEQRSRDLYMVNQQLESAQEHLQLEIKQATYELNVANQRLRKSLNEKSQLIGAISHEIRTPLNAIVGYSELIESGLEGELKYDSGDGSIKQQVQIISQSAASMMSLLNDILEVTQIEVGNIKSNPIVVSLADNFAFIDQMFKLQMQKKGLSWEIKYDNLPDTIRIDIRRYNQIINNLVSNALKYTDGGFVRMYSWYEADSQNIEQGVLHTTVTDSGEGISPEDQDIIFDLYKHISKPEKVSKRYSQRQSQDDVALHSLGLGLPICKALCQLMLGKITCVSEVGKGAQFTVSLPAMIVSEDVIDKVDQGINKKKKQAPLKILIAEDTLLNQQLLIAQLSQLGQSAEIVDNGLMALSKLDKQSYDLVILDILMPVMDGESAIKKIRASEKRIAEHYCVALTAASYQEKGKYLLSMGFDQFMSKPVTLNALSDLINSAYAKMDPPLKKANSDENILPVIPLDMSFFTSQFGDEADAIFSKIAPTYVEQSRLNQQKLKIAIENQDISGVQFIAHAMKGEAKTFCFDELAELCDQLEKSQLFADAEGLFLEISQALDHVLQSIEAHLQSLKQGG